MGKVGNRKKLGIEKRGINMEHLCEAGKRQINAYFRSIDDSRLWPICGRFNATERAIRRVRKFQAASGIPSEGQEYILALEAEISRIVNNQYN